MSILSCCQGCQMAFRPGEVVGGLCPKCRKSLGKKEDRRNSLAEELVCGKNKDKSHD